MFVGGRTRSISRGGPQTFEFWGPSYTHCLTRYDQFRHGSTCAEGFYGPDTPNPRGQRIEISGVPNIAYTVLPKSAKVGMVTHMGYVTF